MERWKCRASSPVIARVMAMASWPTANGMTAATRLPKATSKEYKSGRYHQAFSVAHVVCAGFADVEVEGKFARQFELHGGVAGSQLAGEGVDALVKFGNERLYGAVGGGETHQNECSAALAEEDWIAKIEIRDDGGDAGLVFECGFHGFQRLCAFGRIRGRNNLNNQDYTIHEGRMKASGKLLLDRFRLATLNPGCRLHVALGVKGQG